MAESEHKLGLWARVRSGSTALAAAAVVALPCGQARAATQQQLASDDSASVTRDAATTATRRKPDAAAFLGFRRRVKHGPIHIRGPQRRGEIDMDRIVSSKEARRFTDRDFIFSDSLTTKSDLIEELEELDTIREEKSTQRVVQTVISVGGAVGLVVGSTKLLGSVERWMKQMELRDIEEEQKLTGQYISVDASDVDTSIDPTTGKNLTITKAATKKGGSAGGVAGAADDEKPSSPWILRVLGLDNAVASDDDDFWAPSQAAPSKRDPSGPSTGGAAPGDGEPGGSGGPSGSDGGGEDDDGPDDDSANIDALDDLLG